jgi:hypothetical protein
VLKSTYIPAQSKECSFYHQPIKQKSHCNLEEQKEQQAMKAEAKLSEKKKRKERIISMH